MKPDHDPSTLLEPSTPDAAATVCLRRPSDPVRELAEILREIGARSTFDRHRSTALPCVVCDTTTEPRDLVEIGRYTRPMGGNLQPGDPIVRPMCARCREATAPRRTPEEIGPHEMVGEHDCERCGEGLQHYLHTDRDTSDDDPDWHSRQGMSDAGRTEGA